MPWIEISTPQGKYYYTGRNYDSARAAFERDNPNLEVRRVDPVTASEVPARYRRMAGEPAGDTGGKERAEEGEEREEEYEAPSEEDVMEDTLDLIQDKVNEYVEKQEKAVKAMGGYFPDIWDPEAAKELAIKEFSAYYETRKDEIIEDVEEGRITTAEEYESFMQELEDDINFQMKNIDITEAETQEQLDDRLADIGSSTSFNLDQARETWEDTIYAEREELGETGQIYGGRGRSRIQELKERRGEELAEITRTGGVSQQTAERTAKYTMERAANERQYVEAKRERGLSEAENLARRGIRQYGYEEGLYPEELVPEEGLPQYGRYGQRQLRQMRYNREEKLAKEVASMKEEARAEYYESLKAHGWEDMSPSEYRKTLTKNLI